MAELQIIITPAYAAPWEHTVRDVATGRQWAGVESIDGYSTSGDKWEWDAGVAITVGPAGRPPHPPGRYTFRTGEFRLEPPA